MMERLPVVLFADRDLSWSRAVRVDLRRRGAQVLMAATVDDAMHQAAISPPDLVFLDEDLEGRGDRDLASLFQSAFPQAKIVPLQSGPSESGRAARQRLLASRPRPLMDDTLVDLAQGALGHRLKNVPKVRHGTVLCVDDDPDYLRSVARLLSRRGYRVSAFEDADRALEAIPWLKPDVALVDIMMPGMGGLDLAQKIREKSNGRIPVVFLTALDSDEAFYEGHQHGGSYMVVKAEQPQKMLDVVDYLAGDLDPEEREVLKSHL